MGDPLQINTHTADDQYASRAAALIDGGWVVTWHSLQEGDEFGVYGPRYDSDGNTVGSEFQVNQIFTGDQSYPDIAALDDGGWVITWSSYETSDPPVMDISVHAARFNSNGDPVYVESPPIKKTESESNCL